MENYVEGFTKRFDKKETYFTKMDPIWWTREKACLSIWDLFLYNIN